MTNKKVIIMRGLPGSGKSTKARSYGGVIVSADDYFMHNGEYKYDRTKIRDAHKYCLNKFKEAINNNEPIIVVDNTNVMHWEYQEYVKIANENGYEVIIDVVGDGGLTAEELANRNLHKVPKSAIESMMNKWEGDFKFKDKKSYFTINKISYYPSNPDNVISKTGLTEKEIWQYHDKNKEKIIEYLKDAYTMLKIYTENGVIIKKNNSDGTPIIIDTEKEFERWNGGRSEFHITLKEPNSNLFWIDIDPHENFDKIMALRITKDIKDVLSKNLSEFDDISAFTSGGRGYHIFIKTNKKYNINNYKKLLTNIVNNNIINKYKFISFKKIGKNGLRIDLTTLHMGGSIRAPYSIEVASGGHSRPVSDGIIESIIENSYSFIDFDPNSTENEWRYRLSDPEAFDGGSFRRWSYWAGVNAPNGVSFIVGDLDDGSGKYIQAIRFNKNKISKDQAVEFIKSVKYNLGFYKYWAWD